MASNDNPQAGQGRALPKKEQDLFRNVVKHYEMKQYKKAIKQADAILKKFPKHGETLAMKGLTLNNMGKREEAHTLVKEGLMNDMRSHVCWHVYGLLHRSDRNYNEAIKAYKQALRIDPENLQILRDLSLLQIQMRDLNGFVVTRHTLLTLKSNAKINWLSFALAKHLTGDLRGAISVIDTYLGTLEEGSPELERGFESSELAMYRNMIVAEIPDNCNEALEHLVDCENVVVDRGAWLMTKGSYQLYLGQHDDAKQTFLEMFERGALDEYRVHSGYMCALLKLDPETCKEALNLQGMDTVANMIPLTDDQRQTLLDAYRGELLTLMPRSTAVKRIPLTLLDGDEFRSAIDAYCRKGLTRGVPSLCHDLSSFLIVEHDGRYRRVTDPVDIRSNQIYGMFVELTDDYISFLEADNKFSPNDDMEEEPSTILWAWFLRAGLHELAGEHVEGIALLDKCLEHTPTAVDVYELKARLLKAAGDIDAAVECLDKGRELDKQDRYINNQTTKYMLQAGMQEKALERISLFTRHEGNPEQNLYDMQCSWYELELADSLERKEEWGRSLKKNAAVVKHFEDFHEDQFDFHSYCVRKVTLRAYMDVLRYEDHVWGDDYYRRAAESTIRIYLHLYDNPSITAGEQEPDYSGMTAAQKKKAKAVARKKKKAAEKKAAEAAEKQNEQEPKENGNKSSKRNQPEVVKDTDPDGLELLKKDPLEEANKYSSMLALHAPNELSTWILRYDVAIRRGKALIAMQALFKACAIDAESSKLFARIVDFASKADGLKADQPTAVQEIISDELPVLLNNASLDSFVSAYVDKVKQDLLSSLSTRVDVAQVLVATKRASVADAASLIVDGGLNGRGVTVESCREVLAALNGFGDEATKAKEQWIVAVSERFPLLKDFAS